ncbi:hypothetical protein CHARACLAT_006581 [Characodon lateralis]|uniref:Uncharacterized protein n=1 Tax=Characodon lateralis TaxID=208331 RepID=A0ABU7CVG4_9TELE|nr:hypothetical protein [Characodon lateralis]
MVDNEAIYDICCRNLDIERATDLHKPEQRSLIEETEEDLFTSVVIGVECHQRNAFGCNVSVELLSLVWTSVSGQQAGTPPSTQGGEGDFTTVPSHRNI